MKSGYGHIQLVAPDAMDWHILEDYAKSDLLRQSLDIIGCVYYRGKPLKTFSKVMTALFQLIFKLDRRPS